MTRTVLGTLLSGNEHHVDSLADDHFEGVRDSQSPPAVSVSCSDARVPAEAVWNADEAGDLFTSVNVGNQAWTEIDGKLVVNDAVGYAVSALETSDIVVLGHTGCGAVTAAYEAVVGDGVKDVPESVEAAVSRLVPLVEEAREVGLFDEETPTGEAVNRLVEYAVVRQVEFLTESPEVPESTNCWGFVYDFQHAYGDDDGAAYLVAANGDSDPETLAETVPEKFEERVRSIR
ncbi:carbonic anhydrase [Haloferax mediterranei ATCC 33500]|uniref:carbonic anhydrase n=1 Tax=Haloferax mediterranei (strain ATCC 33500 / DSM 1411 / JCM 8866 / NBRC 14739 / NCIMB 2177 / R-4) TaxID=523841 RepID=I3R357_HALMT|nr:carbonic anhydrase [Haloferax mediterranei]AFK18667.1 carbonic anhydrase [Haloferax mediterranei ATCC 33500]AHZ21962.1 carbonic anhydrase [Haloferax mediterranei ATCC 33500]EMA03473.1 carbonic anhydrase [Haloferax mediterranei ATCC 33500]MDX5988763.1 carbonic anhydrase [Haloferax mediterranei ATCC 33500]QCQ75167.1 carbonic anhydrase [Haloferax mediterranei ATCC 33500]